MTKLIVGLTAAALLASTGTASAVTVIEPVGSSRPYQQWANEAAVRTPDATIEVIETSAPCGSEDAEGCLSDDLRLELRPEPEATKETYDHELGHLYDDMEMQPSERAKFVHLIRQPALPWEGESDDFFSTAPASEWFADSYSICARVPVIARHAAFTVAGADGIIGGPAMRRICAMLR